MTGQTVAVAHWTALDREGEDQCRLAREEAGWILIGHARFRDEAGFAALDYVVRCDTDWQTLTADIAGTRGDRDVKLHILRDGASWHINGQLQTGLADARDIDLGFTPATNLMPVRKLRDGGSDERCLCAAWLDYPDTALRPLDQIYRVGDGAALIDYRAKQTSTTTTLAVDASGFVTLYPGLWQGKVEHAPV
ncbi:putative glycolipid-binding domain-containing protein [Roseovarius aestuariivivens]|uniref:putative glycolipid-binding domain-containing protein n=1 Tax=Roseovarius aestuariivivens TaxID=1888910 RepID=UPI0010811F44|nr:putative glycolipid-binding domain-containing protein [Roseovarius aestuariivivens]